MGKSLEEWRAERAGGEEAELPSGLTVRVRRLSIGDLVEIGEIPGGLAPAVERFLYRPAEQETLKDFGAFQGMVTECVGRVLLGPEGLKAEELPWLDRLALWRWLNDARGLRFFRGEEAASVGVVSDGDGLRATAKRTGRGR